MNQKVLEINRKTGKYEGKGAVPFSNQAAVGERELSEVMISPPESDLPGRPFRRLIVKFVSGHRYIADLDETYFTQNGADFSDEAAIQKLVASKLPDSEVFRRAIRDFSKQVPIVYERWFIKPDGNLAIVGHVARPKRESASDSRSIPKDLFDQFFV